MKQILLTLGLALTIFVSSTITPVALAFAADSTDPAINSVCGAIDCSESRGPTVQSLLKLVLNILSVLIGFVAVVMIVFNGFRFVTSSGEASKVASARSGILYALVGLAVAALAQVLVHFVINQVNNTGSSSKPSSSYCKQHPKDKRC